MYPKLLTKYEPVRNPKTPPEITSKFYDINDKEILPDELMGHRCRIIAAVTVKDIFIGVIPSIQLKVKPLLQLQYKKQHTTCKAASYNKPYYNCQTKAYKTCTKLLQVM